MTVRELIEKLSTEDPDRIVIMASDPEGNSYDTLHDFWIGAWNERHKEVGLEELTEADEKAGYSEDDVIEGVPALILTP